MPRESLKVLTIGNSFTGSLAAFLPRVVESVPGCTLHFERANHGGCELHRHWSYIRNEELDPCYRMYQDPPATMREILRRESWDVVTIQQASHFSWRKETYQPFADDICEYVRRNAPRAEIVVQQTWAYREDDPRIRPGAEWTFSPALLEQTRRLGAAVADGPFHVSQTEMYDRLTEAYTALARHQNLRIIPTGYAVQLARQNERKPFRPYAPELLGLLLWPDLPPQSGDVVGRLFWLKDKETGELRIGQDSIHLNPRGQYLQACLWFSFLFERPVSEIAFVPDEISDADAAFLREMARRAIENFPQVKI